MAYNSIYSKNQKIKLNSSKYVSTNNNRFPIIISYNLQLHENY